MIGWLSSSAMLRPSGVCVGTCEHVSEWAGLVQSLCVRCELWRVCGFSRSPVTQTGLRCFTMSQTVCNGEPSVPLQLRQNHQNLPAEHTHTHKDEHKMAALSSISISWSSVHVFCPVSPFIVYLNMSLSLLLIPCLFLSLPIPSTLLSVSFTFVPIYHCLSPVSVHVSHPISSHASVPIAVSTLSIYSVPVSHALSFSVCLSVRLCTLCLRTCDDSQETLYYRQ